MRRCPGPSSRATALGPAIGRQVRPRGRRVEALAQCLREADLPVHHAHVKPGGMVAVEEERDAGQHW